jgi:hypothetical protein
MLYTKKSLEERILAADEDMRELPQLFTIENVLNGITLLIQDVFGCQAEIYAIFIDPEGGVTEKKVKQMGTVW